MAISTSCGRQASLTLPSSALLATSNPLQSTDPPKPAVFPVHELVLRGLLFHESAPQPLRYFCSLPLPDPCQPDEPAPQLVPNPALLWPLLSTHTGRDRKRMTLPDALHSRFDRSPRTSHAGLVSQTWPSPAMCRAMHGPADGLPSSCPGVQQQHRYGRVVFCPLHKH